MGALARAFSLQRRSNPMERPGTTAADIETYLSGYFSGGRADSGLPVSQSTSTRLAVFWRCVRVLADGIASFPLAVLQRQEPRGRRRVPEHPLYDLLRLEPNPRHTSFTFRSLLMASVVVHGNGYASIRRDAAGRIRELWPVPAQRVEPRLGKDGDLVYRVTMPDGGVESWTSEEMLHVPGLCFDGIKGLSVLAAAREAVGTGLALQKYGATVFARGGRVPGVIKTGGTTINDETRKNIRESWKQNAAGDGDLHTPAVLPKGWDYQDIGVKPDELQWLESRKFSVLEVCRFFGVNPHKVFDYDRATFANFEHSSLAHVVDTLLPWTICFEQEFNRKLLLAEERQRGYFIEFSMQGLMRGDTQTRGTFYALGRQWGFLSINDILELENMPSAGDAGEVRMVPFNMTNAEDLLREPGAPRPAPGTPPKPGGAAARARELLELLERGGRPDPAPGPEQRASRIIKLRRRLRNAQLPLLEDRADMIVKREIGAIEKDVKPLLEEKSRARRALPELRQGIDKFYEAHGPWAAQKMQPLLLAYAGLIEGAIAGEFNEDPPDALSPDLEVFTSAYADSFGAREASEGRYQLLALIDQNEAQGQAAAAAAVQQRLDEWGQKRAGKIGLNEAVQFMAAAAKTLYVLRGVKTTRWVAHAGACPFCVALDGKIAGVYSHFVSAGHGVDAGPDAGPPLKPSDNIGHPPLHSACECDVVAE